MAYWWASQGRNHDVAIRQGTLWTSPWKDGTIRRDRALIKRIEPGDIVIHYDHRRVRSVSRVESSWVPAPRPDGYPKRNPDDLDEGWLVRVSALETDLDLPFQELPNLLKIGPPGPLDKDGSPQQKYLSAISEDEGERVLARLGVNLSGPSDGRDGPEPAEVWPWGATDTKVVTMRRREQARLRAFLIRGRREAPCDLCNAMLPVSLLVAAHIKPRASSDDQHRSRFAAIAMLACVMGCDALYELGYLMVDAKGVIRPGRRSETDAVSVAVSRLGGAQCGAHNEQTAADFASHAALVVSSGSN